MARHPHPSFRGEDALPRFVAVLLRRRPLPGSLASQASAVADPPGSVAGGAFHGRKGRPCDGGERDGSDDEFFHGCVVGVGSRFSLPCHRRPWHHAASGAVDPCWESWPRLGKRKSGPESWVMEIVHTTNSWGSEKSLGLFYNFVRSLSRRLIAAVISMMASLLGSKPLSSGACWLPNFFSIL